MDGILLIHKEAGMTSHDVVARLRRILHTKKIGHSGTLDPDATGVLLVLVGRACKLLPYLEDTDKEYVATMELGKRTLSDDTSGEVLETAPVHKIENLQGVLNTFQGKQKQLPPMVSSIRVNGRKLYEYARAHEEVERPLRDVEFYELEVLDADALKFRVACSSGTYIRSLCVDVACKTGNLGCMSSLVRTGVGRFKLEDCVSLADVEKGNFQLHGMKEVLHHLPMVEYEPILDVYHGKRIRLETDENRVVLMDKEEPIAIYEREHHNVFRSMRGLW
ncbi:MAG: tRNA pseudouridine(55) synthase TruB [Longicatena sp.]